MLDEVVAVECAEVGLGVANVYREKHAGSIQDSRLGARGASLRMSAMSRATLYVIPGSHPAIAVREMFKHKGIDYKRVDLMPVISRGVLKAMRFPGITVPSLRIDGRKITGSREISKALEQIQPEPPLFPADPPERVAVEDAERWGEEILSDATRRILWNAIQRDKGPLRSYLGDARIGVPPGWPSPRRRRSSPPRSASTA